ncbi:hypothetical protein [Burkholderia thailandensis]|uniref:hypothetical protein n=1 Tax=Burkholderia thailandensis TaxID=57975 RepID=UPI00107ECB1D|nr:hypothetical protein [Burkholderia thailandensis]TGB34396.1 hypothetical protein C6946_07145 [Burkholderia thailandensis]
MIPLKEATMLYRKGTLVRLHDVFVDWIVVDAHEVDDYLAQGWFSTPSEVKDAIQAEEAARAAKAAKKPETAAAAEKQS